MNFKNIKGQTMLEVIVLLGVLLIVTSAVVIISVNSLRNSQFSKNQTQATRLSQEGIDKVRTAISRNCPLENPGGAPFYWYENEPFVWDIGILQSPGYYSVDLKSTPCEFTDVTNTASQADNLDSKFTTLFKRQLLISKDSDSTLIVSSIIEWVDFSGTHTSNITTYISKNNL